VTDKTKSGVRGHFYANFMIGPIGKETRFPMQFSTVAKYAALVSSDCKERCDVPIKYNVEGKNWETT